MRVCVQLHGAATRSALFASHSTCECCLTARIGLRIVCWTPPTPCAGCVCTHRCLPCCVSRLLFASHLDVVSLALFLSFPVASAHAVVSLHRTMSAPGTSTTHKTQRHTHLHRHKHACRRNTCGCHVTAALPYGRGVFITRHDACHAHVRSGRSLPSPHSCRWRLCRVTGHTICLHMHTHIMTCTLPHSMTQTHAQPHRLSHPSATHEPHVISHSFVPLHGVMQHMRRAHQPHSTHIWCISSHVSPGYTHCT